MSARPPNNEANHRPTAAPIRPNRALEVARRRELVAQLFVEGTSASQIARQVGAPLRIVVRDLKRIAELWRKILDRDFATAKSQELAKVDRLERAAWEAWWRSTEEEVATKVTLEGEKKR